MIPIGNSLSASKGYVPEYQKPIPIAIPIHLSILHLSEQLACSKDLISPMFPMLPQFKNSFLLPILDKRALLESRKILKTK